MREAVALIGKDLRSEWRAKEVAPGMILFALALVFIFTFTLPSGIARTRAPLPPAGSIAYADVVPVLIWMGILFAALIGFAKNASIESDARTLEALILAPIDPAILFATKTLTNFVYLIVMEALALPIFLLFTGAPWSLLFPGIVPGALAIDVGLASAGTLFAAASQHSRIKDIVFPLLIFPLIIPLVLAAIGMTSAVMRASSLGSVAGWFILTAVFDVVFLTLGLVLYEFVIAE